MELTIAQRKLFIEQGFLRIPGVISPIMIDNARRAINHSVGRGMNVSDMPKFEAQSFCPDVKDTAPVTDLFNRSPVAPLLESVLGAGKVKPASHGQVALRFPSIKEPTGGAHPHLDGMYTPTNGVPPGEIMNFVTLAAVFLSDVTTPLSGNFTVWPGSHRLHSAYFKEHGPQSLLNHLPPIDIGPPVPVMAQAGDLVLAHYLLAHSVSPNFSPNVRYAIFFRVYTTDFAEYRWESMTDPWLLWPGLQPYVGAPESASVAH